MDRRTLLKIAAAGGTAGALTEDANAAGGARITTISSRGKSGHDYRSALDKIIAYAEQDLAAAGMPGSTFCLVDSEGFAAVGMLGWADSGRRIPVTPVHLFQIGSISKSFAALSVFRLVNEGKIDLEAPLSRYLTDVPLPPEPILVQQVLSHTAGLPRNAPVFPCVPDQRLWTGFTPGTKFSYSNTGFELIGMLVEKITGKPYPLALRELVIQPLGIGGLKEVCQASDRADYAIGYSPLDNSGPNLPHVPLGEPQWVNIDTADGNIGATAEGMTRYAQYLIALGRGRGTPLLSDAAATRFSAVPGSAAAAAGIFGPGTAYASGLGIIDLDGHRAFHHTGGSWGFAACITVDPVAGVGCFVGVNAQVADYRPANITKYACRLLRQVREGSTKTIPTEVTSSDSVQGANDYAGIFIAPGGDQFQVVNRSGRLALTADGHEARLESLGNNLFLSDHPRFGSHFLEFEHSGSAATSVWFGPVLYGRGGAVPQPVVPSELAALQGIYGSPDHFSGWWQTVFAQGRRLVIENVAAFRTKDTLLRNDDYWYPEGSGNPAERVRFEAVVNGVPQRLNYSGRALWRFNRI
jgi:CubicO group peptidase (beta-lactamase class C family)